ncbi:hypothetical protein AB0B51_27720 [Streptomyces griseus]|uniref:hypothetical protein n=1 Tax=Streptomyces griseus TaxID=1911 RepID=UPI0004C64B47|nr:hypothetical protein [Streptomyces griseus]
MSEPYDFDFELHVALREGLGRRSERSHGAVVFGQLAKVIYQQLGREDSLRFFRCAIAETTAPGEHGRYLLLSDRLSRALWTEFGDGEDERVNAAWHIFITAHRVAGDQEAIRVSRCILEALSAEHVHAA